MTEFNSLLRRQTDRSRPYLTTVDFDARTELSVTSFTNAADKVANALLSEGLADAGDRIAVHLPWHWQRSVWCAGAWLIGACVLPWGDPEQADVTVADAATSATLAPLGVQNLVTVSLHPLGLGNPTEVPSGAIDGTALVRVQPDDFLGDPNAQDGTALVMGDVSWTPSECLAQAERLPSDQRLALREGLTAMDWVLPVWYPVVGTGSIVLAVDGVDITAEKAVEY
jgi:uncharacterized protein (TIGR03089 family)